LISSLYKIEDEKIKENIIIPVTSIELNPSEVSVSVNSSVLLRVKMKPVDASYKDIIWSSDNEEIAIITNGIVTGVSKGKTNIRANNGDGTVEVVCPVKVDKNESGDDPNSGGGENPDPNPGGGGEDPYPDPGGGENPDPNPGGGGEDPNPDPGGGVTPLTGSGLVAKQKINVNDLFREIHTTSFKRYAVSPKGYATVNSKGLLTAKKAGEITITGCVKSGKKWVPDTEHAVKLKIEKPAFNKKTLESTVKGAKLDGAGNIKGSTIAPTSWKSSKTKVATVDEKTGQITVAGRGLTTITAVYGTGKQAAKYSFKVRVKIPAISKSKATMLTGGTLKLKLKNTKLKPEWSTSDNSIATVADGKVTALTAGKVKITATVVEGVGYTSEITVKPPAIKKSSLTLKAGKSKKVGLKSTKLKNIQWVSSDTNIATVDSAGNVTGVTAGTATISTEAGGVKNSCTVTVR
nr:Ig-like domain-containing protein [Lachnospiraceae bacterium]